MSREIKKKILSKYYRAIESGQKTFELRLANWRCESGDVLILEEVDDETKQPTGRSMRKKVGYVRRTKDFSFWTEEEVEKYGYQIISLLEEEK
ncbi:MAG: DUF3850 domain-containing protein [Candidatus Nomurabacteria bacterium]|jgi:hypothetical protein|nr:DUF3850 domain-containing protein [Candidatus Nomurabacteria bacterium]